MSQPNVLFFSRDPGATNQLVAVHELLCSTADSVMPAIEELRKCLMLSRDEMPQAVIIGKKYALDVWRAAGIQAEDGSDAIPDELIKKRDIALVVTGTDDIDEPDTILLWQAAQQAGIPVAVFLDNLINLDTRFRTRDGALITPDLVFALDHHSTASLAAAGIPENKLRTTENLHLRRLTRIAKHHKGARGKLRKIWQVDDATQVILFASENTTEMAAAGRPAPYDEHAVLKGLLDDLAQGKAVGEIKPDHGPVLVVIRPHPRDSAGKYDEYCRISDPAVLVSNVNTPLEAALAADLVVGMDTALLFEAHALGQPTLSLVANSKFNEIIASTKDRD